METLSRVLRRRALERGQTKVDIENEPGCGILIFYLDLDPKRKTYLKTSQNKPDGAHLELLQYRMPIERLVERDETLNPKGEYPALLLRAKIIEYHIWSRMTGKWRDQ